MGGSSKKVTVGYKYYLGMHQVFCHGPVDRVIKILVDNRVAWAGSSIGGRVQIQAGTLFGGEKREGGVIGAVDVEMGRPTQGRNDYLQSQLGAAIPAYRGVLGLVLRRVYLGVNPYLKKWAVLAQRIHSRQDGIAQWYDAKAEARTYPVPFNGLVEDFGEGLEPYSLVSGSSSAGFSVVSTPYGDGMQSTSSSGGAWIERAIARITQPDVVSFKFKVSSIGVDDAGRIAFMNSSGGTVFELVTVRDGGIDASRRAHINPPYGGSGLPLSDEQLEVGVWHSLTASFDWNAGELTVSLTKDGESVGSVMVALSSVENIAYLRFGADTNAVGTGTSVFSDIRVTGVTSAGDMNPAHIIRECLTDPDWGMGYGESDIDDVSFMAAADTLYDEGMGMSILWDRQMPIEDFVKEVIKHIDGSLYVSRTTGKFELKLLRADYVKASLPHLTEDNIDKVENFGRPEFGELVNSVTVNFHDPDTNSTASVTVQDSALVQMQGAVVNTTVQYPGFTDRELAVKVGLRDLRTLSSPLRTATVYCDRSAAGLEPGSPFRMSWPDLEIHDVVFRVTSIGLGDGRSNKVRLTVIEDAFEHPSIAPVASPTDEWTDPSTTPQPASRRAFVEAPYYEVVQNLGQTDADSRLTSNPDIGYLAAAAGRPSGGINATVQINSGAGYEDAAALDFCPSAVLASPVGPTDVTFMLTGADATSEVSVGSHAQIGDELVRVDAISESSMTVGRGVLDTVPAAHAAGATVLFWDELYASDDVEYVSGETVQAKMLTSSIGGVLTPESAPVDSVTLAGRAARPYPPADVKINGEYYPAAATAGTPLTVTWVHRDRRQQTSGTLYDYFDGGIGPEAGTTYTVRITTYPGGALLAEETGIAGTTSSALDPAYTGEVLVEVFSIRDGLESLFRFEHVMDVETAPPIEEEIYMDFEGADGAALFEDFGQAGSVWTRSGASVALTTTTPLAGVSSLLIGGSTNYLETDYDADNSLPATGDWDLSMVVRAGTWVSGGLGRYLMSAQDASATAAGTAFALATNASRTLQVILSDGTTRSVVVSSGVTLSDNTTYTVLVTRRTNTISLTINGGTPTTGTFSGSIPLPAGRKLRIGKPEASASSAGDLRVDTLRFKRL